jgi:16S rRNA (adenine1518-N6/adenine1519-N6)-dimethyltransferase
MVEIGGGPGALTAPLVERLEQLDVVELDRELAAELPSRVAHPERLVVHHADALRFDFTSLARGPRSLRVVGNLPYNISTPLLFHLASFAEHVRDMHFMLQKEVVERMVAEPGTNDFGRLSVMLQYRFVMDWLIDVPPESFDPAPKVDSAVVRLIPRPPAELTVRDEAKFAAVVSTAFGQRRKMLRNTLKGMLDDAGFAALGISPTARAEDLAVGDYIRIANYLTP